MCEVLGSIPNIKKTKQNKKNKNGEGNDLTTEIHASTVNFFKRRGRILLLTKYCELISVTEMIEFGNHHFPAQTLSVDAKTIGEEISSKQKFIHPNSQGT
jgi:hypothetical protein